ncbi:MAG: ATP synthase F1 subunit epsilon [Bacteroidales bacterium]
MKLEIITPEKRLFDGKVKLVQVPGTKGSFEILKNHAPVISTLTAGKVKVITQADKQELFDVVSGIVEVKGNIITILAVTA